MDEDQTFEIFINFEAPNRYQRANAVEVIERLLDYLDYTGQNTISYPFIRYDYTFQDLPGGYTAFGLRTKGWQHLMLDMFQRRGKKIIATCNIYITPEISLRPELINQWGKKGYFIRDKNGRLVNIRVGHARENPVHPDVRRQLLHHIGNVIERYGRHEALDGLDLWFGSSFSPWSFGSLGHGYGDFTVSLFEKETGIRVKTSGDKKKRFEQRFRQLIESHHQPWLQWRAGKTFELIQDIDRLIHKVRPGLRLYLPILMKKIRHCSRNDETLEDMDLRQLCYNEYALDISALSSLPSVSVVPVCRPTLSRWIKFRGDISPNAANEVFWDPAKHKVFRATATSGTWCYHPYFETRRKSLKPDNFNAHFQNADVKPHGRYFLQELGQALAGTDASVLLVGGQPLGTAGRDEPTREFARAYLALPAGKFGDVPGAEDPVVVRYLNTSNGTYLYAINLTWSDLSSTVTFDSPITQAADLSTGKNEIVSNSELSISLKPFELRSFRLKKGIKPTKLAVEIPDKTRFWYKNQLATLQKNADILGKNGAADVLLLDQRIQQIRQALKQKELARAHRLIFSKRMQNIMLNMLKLLENARKGYLKEVATMIAKSRYAINCGGSNYYRSSSGTLFFPDRKFAKGGYGYDGSYCRSNRNVDKIKGAKDAALFSSEAYDLDAYRFSVKPGRYTVRLYLKAGFKPKAKPGYFVMSVSIENRQVMKNEDIFVACGSDFNNAIIKQFDDIEVTDGVLDIVFSCPLEASSTVRMCNAIEIIPQHK